MVYKKINLTINKSHANTPNVQSAAQAFYEFALKMDVKGIITPTSANSLEIKLEGDPAYIKLIKHQALRSIGEKNVSNLTEQTIHRFEHFPSLILLENV